MSVTKEKIFESYEEILEELQYGVFGGVSTAISDTVGIVKLDNGKEAKVVITVDMDLES